MKVYTKDGERELNDLTGAEKRRFEAESTLNWNELESVMCLSSSSEREWKRIEKYGIKAYRETTDRRTGRINAKWYRVPTEWRQIKPPVKKKLTDEQRKKLSETAKARFGKRKEDAKNHTIKGIYKKK